MAKTKTADSKSLDQSANIKEAEKGIQNDEIKASEGTNKTEKPESQETITPGERDYYKTKIAELEEKIRSLEETSSNEDKEVFKNKRVTVHHGVVIPKMGTFTKEQILASKEAQDYLLEIKSSAISLNK